MASIEKCKVIESEEDSLVRQFEHLKKLRLANGETVSVVDVAPEHLTTEVPILIAPGFSATPPTLKDLIIRTAQSGRRVVSINAPHGIRTAEKNAELPDIELRKLEMVLETVAALGIEQINIIAHSEAAIYITAAALLFPKKFANIVLVEPAGLIGKDSPFKLIRRFIEDMQGQAVEDKDMRAKDRILKYPSSLKYGIGAIASNPRASLKEVQAIAASDISTVLQKLQEAGVGVSIVHAVDDKVFPMEKVQQNLVRKGSGDKTNALPKPSVDGFYSVTGTHGSMYLYEPYGRAALAALNAQEKKQKARKAK